ncbi:MAG TPA: flippase-like domain-containing protein [Methanoregula sp.]|nr:flippase-like domain-containing protein [Methanoregula sp.]
MDIKKNSFRIIQGAIAIVIILLLLGSIDYIQASAILLHLDWSFLILAAFFYFLNNVIMAVRLKRILAHLGNKIRFRIAFLSHMSGMLLSDFTPGRSGYLYVAFALNRKGVSMPKGIAAITSTYIYDLLFKISLAIVAVYYFYATITGLPVGYILYLIVILFFLIVAGYILTMYPGQVLQDVCQRNTYLKYILDLGEQSRAIQKISPYIISVSFIGWIFRGLEWYFVARAIGGMGISLLDSLLLNPLLTILSLIPITPAGLGIQEAGIVGLLTLLGVSFAAATAFAFLTRFMEIIIDLIGLKNFFSLEATKENLLDHYRAIDGDIDEKAYNSDLCTQRFFQRRRTGTIRRMLGAQNGEVILDIGCGSGVQLRALDLSSPGLLIGMDLNHNALLYARGKNNRNTEFLIADAERLPFREKTVDRIICAEIIEHLHEPEKMIAESKRVLKDPGKIVISTPNEHSVWGVYEFFWDVLGRGRNYRETHLKFFSVPELETCFTSYPERAHTTLFFISPLVALLGNRTLVHWAVRFDGLFERINTGVIIVFSAKKQ